MCCVVLLLKNTQRTEQGIDRRSCVRGGGAILWYLCLYGKWCNQKERRCSESPRPGFVVGRVENETMAGRYHLHLLSTLFSCGALVGVIPTASVVNSSRGGESHCGRRAAQLQ